jgi:hypothetical protein
MTPGELAKGSAYRRRFKRRVFRVIFGRNREKGRYPNVVRARLRARFPTVAGVLRKLKARNYRHSSHLLQNFEATLFIYQICGRIMRERPDAVVFTVHDSILTTPDNAPYVAHIIEHEFAKLGVTPTLRQETYT